MSFEKDLDERMRLQKAEFDAVSELVKQYRRITLTAVVDNDYPSVRWDYDHALEEVLKAVMMNRGKDFVSFLKST